MLELKQSVTISGSEDWWRASVPVENTLNTCLTTFSLADKAHFLTSLKFIKYI